MEGMISCQLVGIQTLHRDWSGEGPRPMDWASKLVVWLLEVTHGQWIYHNIQVHDD